MGGCIHILIDTIVHLSVSAFDNIKVKFDISVCGQVQFFDPIGTISSPNYPIEYPVSTNCIYFIDFYEYHNIILTFLEPFELENGFDYVKVDQISLV